MIEIHDLTVSYKNRTVLDHICVNFNSQEIHGVVGLNGAGKTSFFNTLAGVIQPAKGTIFFGGKKALWKDVGFLETQNFFYSNITGNEYLSIFPSTNLQFRQEAFRDLLKIPLDQLIDTYSTGMRKKLALLAVLKQDKQVYIFDEPFNGLDLETNKVVEVTLSALKAKGKTIFMSSHILEPLLDICDRIHILGDGRFKNSYARAEFSHIKAALFDAVKLEAARIVQDSI